MGKNAAIGGGVGVVVTVALYVLLGVAMDDTAALARELRASGETVHARVTRREHRENRVREGGRTRTEDHYVLGLEGALASGSAWSASPEVGQALFDVTLEGAGLDVVVLAAQPETYMLAVDLAARDASGHEAGEGVMRIGLSLAIGAVVALLTFVVRSRRAR